jgi:hypothetical protein
MLTLSFVGHVKVFGCRPHDDGATYSGGRRTNVEVVVSDILATPNSLKLHVGVGHRSRYPQNSKSLLAGSNSSKRGLTVRGMFTPSDRKWE